MTRAELLTPLELDFLWESFGAGELPYPLEFRSHGATLDERADLRRQTMAELARRGVANGRGRPEPHVENFFEMLASSDVSLDSVHLAAPNARPLLAVAAGLGGEGVLAVQDERGFHFHPAPADGLASAIVSLLPPAPRGAEKSITVPLEQLLTGTGADFLQRRVPDASGRVSADEDRKALARLQAQPRLRGGQIGANARGRLSGKVRTPVLSWFDTDSGRYFTQASRGHDGRDWITIAPADAASLRQRLNEMLSGAASTTMAPGGAW
ncbi:ESX secretion-associated protein EspG [Amycolatopsis acidiphila]|uniref:ESX secretion-associated protein EspG n=1 Tax=Amycolatopsis acidiphila TaxID=715473 RepID=A0A557ZS44_9PSEU|nr:ESX secretion-associated protein EspG [Amycolatopsis acidiphila]TVT14768.1 ESX secretion-associated protein EspG [Amycolatopsis acidiphila]UIJ59450.1 ESX secretion-associated protein EspG [Amycolatopsis acidiphila]GHG94560.1 ESX secretion-associated protein EspG [Amycolatopsis acidiphila]